MWKGTLRGQVTGQEGMDRADGQLTAGAGLAHWSAQAQSHWTVVALMEQRPPGTAQGPRKGLAGPSSPQLGPGRIQRRQLCLG